ncbi:MAG: methyl-accepting chemotaxis protein [Defluviitaleaceae bacterium]|nr:methyl-accepting chemotaxis protein [Defluviitaleaceae bacterium]
MKNIKNIGTKLTLIMSCIVLLGMSVTTGVSIYVAGGVITDETLAKVTNETSYQAMKLDKWLSEQQTVANTMAEVMSHASEFTDEQIFYVLTDILESNKGSYYQDVYLGFTDDRAVMAKGFGAGGIPDTWKPTQRDWYRAAISDINKTHVTSPYMDAVTGELCITLSRAILRENSIIGVVGIDVLLTSLNSMTAEISTDDKYGVLLDTNGDFIIHPTFGPSRNGTMSNISTVASGALRPLWNMISRTDNTYKFTNHEGILNYYSIVTIPSTDWKLLIVLPASAVSQPIKNLVVVAVPIAILLLVISAAIIFWAVKKQITQPIKRVVGIVSQIAHGNMNINTSREQLTQDEIGSLTQDVYSLADVIKAIINDMSGIIHEFSINGDIEYRLNADKYEGSFGQLIANMNRFADEYVNEVMIVINALGEVGDGNFNMQAEKLPGKKILMYERLTALTVKLNAIHSEIRTLARSAAAGDLKINADETKYKGGWAELLRELNGLVNAVAEPLGEIERALGEMQKGNFDTRMKGEYKGSFSAVKDAVNSTEKTTLSYINEIAEVLGAVSDGDLTATVKQHYAGSYAPIKTALSQILESLNKTMSEINSSAEQVLSGAGQISKSALHLASGSTKQASAIEELTASMDTINEKTQLNSKNATSADEYAKKSATNVKNSNKAMKLMESSMHSIQTSSNDIAGIIKTIEDISFQTNLLALNAAVEAARAGEHGKGFAVVAEEVRNLAARSQLSAKDTTTLIGDSSAKVSEGMGAANEAAKSLETILSDMSRITEIISTIAKMSVDQSESIEQISIGINEIAQVIQSNSATSEQCAAAAEELNSQAEILKQMVSFFKLK